MIKLNNVVLPINFTGKIVLVENIGNLCIRNQQIAVAKGYKNGRHDKNRDFVRTKIVPTANIVTSILIS